METVERSKVCGVEDAGILDVGLRKLFQNPRKIVAPYLEEGMTAFDLGCGPGFFTIEMAKIVGPSGEVVAVDLQDGMLEIVKKKIENTDLQNIIELHKCQSDKIGLTQAADFILIFYMLHEVPDQLAFLKEVHDLLKPNGKVLIVEPKFHVTKEDFKKYRELLKQIGFGIVEEPNVFFSRSFLINKIA
jgi:ubiquinone/menaquinone biosynthesis C-methylase UbiE